MPKAKPIPDNAEDEKTTVESQWEEEASTTVEQGDVADKIRELAAQPRSNNTGATGTGALDEPTVDDQNAPMSAITPLRDNARLVITQGNDAGQETEVRPGKTYTIGRAIDNDVVLTDISVSRKHFDLRFEDGAWLIMDRGSGNGTVVNGNLEDNPFLLANGDVIEIGNTVFRFDHPNGASRPQPYEPDDDEEMSTVAGKPLRSDSIEIIEEPPPPPLNPMPIAPLTRPQRSKTLPPPLPLRSNSPSAAPPFSLAPPQPASTLPLPQMANRPPIAGPGMPTMMAEQHPLPGVMPTTIPGQGAPGPRPLYAYPQASEIPPHSVHAQMMMIQTQNRRDSGPMGPPTPFDSPVAARASRGYAQPQISKRAKLVLAAIGLAVFAAVATIAIMKSSSGNKSTKPAASAGSADKKLADQSKKMTTTTVEPIKEPTVPTVDMSKPPQKPEHKIVTVPPPEQARPEPPKPEPAKPAPKVAPPPKVEPPKVVVKPDPPKKKREEKKEKEKEVEVATAADPEPAPPTTSTPADPRAEAKADSLYRDKKFNEAASLVQSAAAKASGDRAKNLRKLADLYKSLGKEYFTGMAAGTNSKDAFDSLRRAQNFDRQLANHFDADIQTKLAQVAPRAAISFMATHAYLKARDAVLVAEKFGATEGVKLVRQKLESVASEIYAEASKELEGNPSSAPAKEKLRQIQSMVDQKSPWWQKADKLLKGS